ncbi:binding-protein-dependent transport systems inner membrane component [Paenibacillus mucilaginosus 3016]|uniref:Binding-protein-dependent transport systems inner membrane component n=2 Tax=Paenibacillus mucilaginosus TaxID=61624 RepID=H6NID0_9BACL|nr:nickel transporter permease [Paenibacillus mucilaginosus]AFC31533.1 binding-protein-dependent transport systems inner membrane component [Paenibacillus mucilaginosus 3016]AFH63878.1 nickel ABC transporter permease [Paenibacillus mucilaginosus K02]WFA20074.1 ABC transporter permease subunit [Paenibacillus mucilaginosus]
MSLVHSPPGLQGAAGPRRSLVLRMLSDPMTAAGLFILALLLGLALLGPLLVANDPLAVNMAQRLQPPSLQYPLGTDSMGRCLFSRLAAGAQTTLGIPVMVLAMVMAIGIPAGLLAGYAGGRIDALLMRTVDGMSVVPDFLLVIAVSGFLGPSLNNLILSIVLINWCGYARLIRGIVLSEREKDYVLAARVAGGRVRTILWRHLLPQVVSPVLVYAALDMGKTILVISSMSYLGLGAQPPSPEWGAMLNDGRSYFQTHPELMIYPGMAILLVVVSFNLIGEGLRDLLDVRSRG